MEQFTKEVGGLRRGSVKLPKGGENNPLKTHSGGLGGDTFKHLKPWIRGEIYEYEDGEREWEEEQIDRLNDEALGYDSDFSSNAGMDHSEDEGPDEPSGLTETFFNHLGVSEEMREKVRLALGKSSIEREKNREDLQKSLKKIRQSLSAQKPKAITQLKSGRDRHDTTPFRLPNRITRQAVAQPSPDDVNFSLFQRAGSPITDLTFPKFN